jgi:uncharacterized phage protein gp47/JayE
MATLTQQQIAEQMVAQIRLLKPTISAEVGTPERLILDTVSGAISETSVDLVGLQEALSVDNKFGSNLTNFLSIFGFNRQEAASATGFIKFKRNAPANVPIVIPAKVILRSHTSVNGIAPEFETTTSVTLPAGELETGLVPIRALKPGALGNVPAESITIMVFAASVLGITGVTNPAATSGGSEQENDNELKTRFKNTVFRNLAGTEDQFLALSVATAFTTKAIVVGPVSKYQEYVQVPGVKYPVPTGDDTTAYSFGGGTAYAGYPWPMMVRGNLSNKTITVTTTNEFGLKIGDPVEVFKNENNPEIAIASKITGLTATTITIEGKWEGKEIVGGWVFAGSFTAAKEALVNKWTTALSTNPFAKEIWKELPIFISDITSGISKFFFREGVDFEFNYPPKLQGDALRAMIDGVGVDPRTNIIGKNQPNITFTNVYLGAEEAIKALRPEDVVLLEYSYTSTSSRNSVAHNVTNAIDVFIDGTNEQATSTIFTAPLAETQKFEDNPTSKYYYENFRRDGEPTKRPLEGNILTPLYNQPVVAIPNQIVIGANKFYLGVHYWLVHDVSGYGGSLRARDGIEWSHTTRADLGKENEGRPTTEKPEREYTGQLFSEIHSPTAVEIEPYFYDQNIEDLQASLEASRQVTTDVLAHKARTRYFKLNVTVVYAPQANPAIVNNNVREAVANFFASQYFGSVIRLSDLLQIIHNVGGIENVRWSNDTPNDANLIRVYQTDIYGAPLEGVSVERFQWGSASGKEIQALYIVGNPERGEYQLSYGVSKVTKGISPIEMGTTAAALESQINKVLGEGTVKVKEVVRSTIGVTEPIRSFLIEYQTNGMRTLPTVIYPPEPVNKPLAGGEYTFDSDFFLRDDELPALPTGMQEGDTVPGLIIKSRAENVWGKA